MQYPDVEWSRVACLGKDVACDGFISSSRVRVQIHIHLDHMNNFIQVRVKNFLLQRLDNY